MNISTKLAIFLVVAGLTAGIFNVTNMAFADKPQEGDPDRNLFGKEASDLADEEDGDNEPGSEMGEHSRAGGSAGDPPFDSDGEEGDTDKPGRFGIGNVGEALTGEKKHPSEVIELLCGEGGQNCPEAIAD